MTSTPGSSFGGGPEKKVGGIIVPESLIEQKAKLNQEVVALADKKKDLEAIIATPPQKPVDDFGAFKQNNKIETAKKEIRAETVNILTKTPNFAADVMARNQNFYSIINQQKPTWKQVVNNPELVAIAKETTAQEKAALTPSSQIIIPEDRKLRGQSGMSLDARTEGDLRLKKDGTIEDSFILRPEGTNKGEVKPAKPPESGLDLNLDISKEQIDAQKAEADALIARLEARNLARQEEVQKIGKVTVNNFSAEEQARKKAEWLRDNPQEGGLENVDINLATLEDEAIERQRKLLANAPKDTDARMILTPVVRSPEVKEKLEGDFAKTVEQAPQRMEKISQALENRRKASQGNLEKMGANWLSKSLEAFKNVRPGYKIALGVTLAGASIATGGLTALVGAGIMKGMSSFSYGSAIYEKMLKLKQEGGHEVNKAAIATNAVVLGIGAALATSWIASEVFSHVDVPKALVGAKETVKGWWDSLVGATPEVVPNTDFSKMPINGLVMDDGLTGPVSPVQPLPSPEGVVIPENLVPLPEYTVQSGDNLTKIIREQVLSKIPELESMTEPQKSIMQNNMIENYLKGAASLQGQPFFDPVNQFANPNIIQPGAKINLDLIRMGMTEFNFGFNEPSLLDHAKTITGSASSGGVFSSGAPTPVTAASVAAQPLTPVNPADLSTEDMDAGSIETPPQTTVPRSELDTSNLASQPGVQDQINRARVPRSEYLDNA